MLTELDIARSLLANQRHQELAAMEAQQQQQQPAGAMGQRLIAFPVQLGSMQFNPQVRVEGVLWAIQSTKINIHVIELLACTGRPLPTCHA